MRRGLRTITVAISAGILAACATSMVEVPPGTDDYRAGYRDGCDSGYAVAGNGYYRFAQDSQRADTVASYRRGWTVGFAECERNFRRIQRSIFVLLTP